MRVITLTLKYIDTQIETFYFKDNHVFSTVYLAAFSSRSVCLVLTDSKVVVDDFETDDDYLIGDAAE